MKNDFVKLRHKTPETTQESKKKTQNVENILNDEKSNKFQKVPKLIRELVYWSSGFNNRIDNSKKWSMSG